MKHLILILLGITILLSCTKSDDYKKYIDGQERIYRAKPSQLVIKPGFKRALVQFKLYSPVHVTGYEIYADDTKVASGKVSFADSVIVETLIENLEEKTYQIDVVSIDDEGQRSVKSSGFLNVYGDRVKSTLNQRVINLAKSEGPGELFLQFAEAESNIVKSLVTYMDINQKEKTFLMSKSSNDTTLFDVDLSKTLKYSTFLLPIAQSIDTLQTGYQSLDLASLDRHWFSSEEVSGEGATNGRLIYLFDSDPSTYWHTQYVGQSYAYPHWFILDLGTSKTPASFTIQRRIGSNTLPTKVKLEIKDLGQEWKSLGEYKLTNADGPQVIKILQSQKGRYLRFTGLEGPTAHTCIAEFKIN